MACLLDVVEAVHRHEVHLVGGHAVAHVGGIGWVQIRSLYLHVVKIQI